MATSTSGSFNISVLDSKIVADLCNGIFIVDVSPSIFIGTGALSVLGANVKVVSPLGVAIKNYSTSGYDIEGGSPPMMDTVEIGIPTTAGNYQYGSYIVTVELFDAGGASWTIEKSVTISIPDTKNKTRNFGVVKAEIKGLCMDGKATIQVTQPPNYRGAIVESVEQEFTLEYPTESELTPLVTSLSAFSVLLYEGEYNVYGEICALYNFGDNVYAKVKYKVNASKVVKCILNYECIGTQLAALIDEMNGSCTDAEKSEIQATIVKILGLVKAIEFLADYNQDTSDYINQLDDLLGCSCTCGDIEGTQIINNNPAKDFLIEGCGVVKTTVGLTDHYTIENHEYLVAITNNGGVLNVSSSILSDCTKTQTITFDITTAYSQIKNLANTVSNEDVFWASIINKVLSGLTDAPANWDTYTFAEKIQWILSNITTVNAQNGLTPLGYTSTNPYDYTIELGGALNKNTTINFSTFNLLFTNVPSGTIAKNLGLNSSNQIVTNTNIVLTGSGTLNFGTIDPTASQTLTITLTGAAIGDVVAIGIPNASVSATDVNDVVYQTWVSATNTVSVRAINVSSGVVDPASGTFTVKVFK